MADPAAPRIGAVVIGRNEGARLVACLESIVPLEIPIVYVDSGSTDGSVPAARAAGALVVELDLARPFTAARARNEGAQALLAHDPGLVHIQFVDGDCTVVPGWIEAAAGFLDDAPNYAVACGRRRERDPGASPYNRLADIEWDTPVGDAAACGGDALFRVAAFRAADGFDPAMIAGEEPELCSRLTAMGWRIRRLPADMTMHDAAMFRFGQWWRRAIRGGFGYAQAWATTRSQAAPLYGRELARAIGWTFLPPLAGLALAFVHPAGLLLAPLIWSAQIVRMAVRFGPRDRFAWLRAILLTLGKPAEAWGAIKFVRRLAAGATGGTIFYK